MFTRAIALNLRNRGLRCTAPCPGFIEPPQGVPEMADLQVLGMDMSEAATATAPGPHRHSDGGRPGRAGSGQ
jgi:NAD(P)-dependent dehydrogenase (short-subunit alcohol dehydrogenase family)